MWLSDISGQTINSKKLELKIVGYFREKSLSGILVAGRSHKERNSIRVNRSKLTNLKQEIRETGEGKHSISQKRCQCLRSSFCRLPVLTNLPMATVEIMTIWNSADYASIHVLPPILVFLLSLLF